MADGRASALLLLVACAGDPMRVSADAPRRESPGDDASVVVNDEQDAGDAAEEGPWLTANDAGTDARARFIGGLSEAEVRRIVTARRGLFTACFGIESQRNPELQGRARFSWMIDPAGTVTIARLDDSTLGSSRVEGCVLRQLRALRFPSAPTPTQVIGFPMTFRTTD